MKRLLPLLLVLTIFASICLGSCDLIIIPNTQPESGDESVSNETLDEYSSESDGSQGGESDSESSDDDPAEDETCGGSEDGEHSDADDNGLCDECGSSVIIVLDVFAINDLHGKFADSSAQIGVDEMTTYLKNAYKTEDHVIFLSSGDMWQGSSESNLTKGNIITEWLNELDVVSMTLGNHEYDWGEELIEQNAALAEFPFLAINVYDSDTNERAEYCQPSVTVQRGGATIGIIGAIGDCYSSISGEVSDGFYFKTGNELTALVKAEAQRLRSAGVDYIIYSIHDGYGSSSSGVGSISDSRLNSYYDPSLSEGYVDIVFEAHTHQHYVLRGSDGVYHLQGGGDNKGITHAEVSINFANGNSNVSVAEYLASSVYKDLSGDPIVEDLMDKYEEQVAQGSRVLGTNDFLRDSYAIRDLVAALYLEAGQEMFSDQYDIVLGGGFLSVRSPYSLAAGQVTYSQLQMLLPFDNELVLCSIKGSDLESRFINTTNSNYFVSYSDYGNSVKNSIDPNATYYVIVDTYTSTYSYNRLTEIARYTPEVYARDLLADYIEKGGLSSGKTEIEYTSIPDIISIGESLVAGGTSAEAYYVKGKVASVENTTYGNLYIEDEDGNRLFIYGVYDSTGSVRYDSLTNPPVVGDEIALYGQIKHYLNISQNTVTIELINAKLVQ